MDERTPTARRPGDERMADEVADTMSPTAHARRFSAGTPRELPATLFRASRTVALMKLLLPALALAIVALILTWPQLIPDHANFRLGDNPLRVTPSVTDGLTMDNPRYVGVDEQQRPFQVTARRASQVSRDANRLQLETPQADIAIAPDEWLALTAKRGIYDKNARTIDLDGDVTLYHDRGYTLSSPSARVSLSEGSVSGDQPISGHGPSGTVEGEGFRVLDRGARFVFTGKSKVTFVPAEAPKAPAKPAAKAPAKGTKP